jgi:putative ABC transport system permease protein
MSTSRPSLRIVGMRPSALLELYRWHLRGHKLQELLAAAGIAIGVALLFGVLVANSSVAGSASQLVDAVTGDAQLQLAARSPTGFDEALLGRVRELRGVSVAAPLLRENVAILGPRDRASIQLVGLTPAELELHASATRNLGAGALLLANGLGLPSAVAGDIGASPGQRVTILAGGIAHRVLVRAILGSQLVGAIANSPIAVALLKVAQRITARPAHITQILVDPKHGAKPLVERELRTLAAGHLDVQSASHEVSVLKATAAPTSQSSSLFASISAMVGFLFALNAVMLTLPERRRFIADLREQGFGPSQIAVILVSQAVMLGLAATLVGVALGDLLSRSLFHEVPSYLTFAFPIGSHSVITLGTVFLAVGCGIAATVLASLLPLMDLRHDRSEAHGESGHAIARQTTLLAGVVGGGIVLAASVVVLLDAALSVLGGVALALAALFLVLPLYELVIRGLKPASENTRGSMLTLAIVELDATATRSIALAGIAAVAVFGMLAVEGARSDLIRGLESAVVQYLRPAQLWVTADDNFLTIDGFQASTTTTAIKHIHGVASVRDYQGSLLDVGTRRLWIRARPPQDSAMIQASQLLHGNLAQATNRLRQGGWAAISGGYAAENDLKVGDAFTLPTPSGAARLRVAAITTNVGWPPGAITLNTRDYARLWQTAEATALEINLKPGVSLTAGKTAVQHALRNKPGLIVETLAQREAHFEESARQGIKGLSEIATLLLVATALAIAAALSTALLQRRPRLASLKTDGFDSHQLWRSLLIESTILIGIGCLDGTVLGIYGHALASRWLSTTVGFPAPFSIGIGLVGLTLALITAISLTVISIPGLIASRVPVRVSFQE